MLDTAHPQPFEIVADETQIRKVVPTWRLSRRVSRKFEGFKVRFQPRMCFEREAFVSYEKVTVPQAHRKV